MKFHIKMGRFQNGPEWKQFFMGLADIARRSSRRTETEEIRVKMKGYLREDLKKWTKGHEDGLDPKSIVVKEIAKIQPIIVAELHIAEIEAIRVELDVIEKLRAVREDRLNLLLGQRGSVVLMQRERDKKLAFEAIRRREANG